MAQKEIFWTIGSYSYFGLLSSYILSEDKVYRSETMDTGKIPLKNGVNGICKFNYPSKYCGNYCAGLGTLIGFSLGRMFICGFIR